MKNVLLRLLDHSDATFNQKEFDQLTFTNDNDLIHNLNTLFADPLMDYSVKKAVVTKEINLPDAFIIAEPVPLFITRQEFNYVTHTSQQIDINDILNKEIIFIVEKPKQKSSQDFLDTILGFYPKINFLLLLTVPFVLIPAFYANLFNTRMIFNDFSYTLIFVTSIFIGLWLLDYTAKHFIKDRSLAQLDKSSQKIEKYFFYLIPFVKTNSLITKIKMIESNRKILWENLSGVLTDIASFVILISVLFILLGYLGLLLFLFYVVIIVFATYMRYKNYKLYLELEANTQDLLVERLSYYKNNQQLPYLKMEPMQHHFGNMVKNTLKIDYNISKFNFDWDEFVRFSSFAATFVLFITIFYQSKMDPAIFNVLIALLIVNSRTSAAVVSLVTKTFYVLISAYHMRLATDIIFENVDDKVFETGFRLEHLKQISTRDLSISVEGRVILKQVKQKFDSGNIYAFFGPIGTGKSTLLKVLIGQHDEFSGEILYNNTYGVRDIDTHFFATKVAYIDPSSDFVKGSISYNFELRGCRDKNFIAGVLKEVFPNSNIDYDFVFVQDITEIPMSTGQKRKLLLYMSLNKDKELVILDEALINLSYKDISVVVKTLKNYMKNAIIFIISHDKNILNLADYVYELDNKQLNLIKSSVIKV